MDFLQALPDRVMVAIPVELVVVDQPARRHAGQDHPGQEAIAAGEAEVAGRFPAAAAGVFEGLLGIARQRIGRFGLGAAEVVDEGAGDSGIEGRRHRGDVAAAGRFRDQDDAFRVDPRLGQQDVDAAHQVPDEPAHQAVADQVEQDGVVVAMVVILSADGERSGMILFAAEGMLPALTVAQVIRDQDQAAGPRPGHGHVLPLANLPGLLMAQDDDDAGHRLGWPGRAIEIGADQQPGPAFIDQVIDAKPVAFLRAGHAQLQVLGHGRELAERYP